jgi:ATP-dependent Clp protease protease subunit
VLVAEERTYDIYSRLLKERIVFIGSEIDDTVANVIMAQLLFLQFEDKRGEIRMYLNSPGGSVTSALAIHDTMKFVQCPIATYAIDRVAGVACLLLAAGKPGMRFAASRAQIRLVRLTVEAKGDAREAAIQAAELVKLKKAVYEILAPATGKTIHEIERAHEAQESFDAERARAYGLVDDIVEVVLR